MHFVLAGSHRHLSTEMMIGRSRGVMLTVMGPVIVGLDHGVVLDSLPDPSVVQIRQVEDLTVEHLDSKEGRTVDELLGETGKAGVTELQIVLWYLTSGTKGRNYPLSRTTAKVEDVDQLQWRAVQDVTRQMKNRWKQDLEVLETATDGVVGHLLAVVGRVVLQCVEHVAVETVLATFVSRHETTVQMEVVDVLHNHMHQHRHNGTGRKQTTLELQRMKPSLAECEMPSHRRGVRLHQPRDVSMSTTKDKHTHVSNVVRDDVVESRDTEKVDQDVTCRFVERRGIHTADVGLLWMVPKLGGEGFGKPNSARGQINSVEVLHIPTTRVGIT